MKKLTLGLLLVVYVMALSSCSNNDDIEPEIENLKNVTDCNITIEPDLLVAICIDGTDVALPDEIITFVSTFYSKIDIAANTQFMWDIESGNMEILTIENSVEGSIAKSIATIRFDANYSGSGIIGVTAENDNGSGYTQHIVELE
ncbi:hypothetical protein [uncultured Psychroserpens sp.]|uniref:hypothetical protein n=1 Tax=uncultured Psychroserpens sp. TaxID=255436 RepID=UPI0026121524|nr:hypothetical protein [uncultured Psychroserpens sp.]